MLETGLGGGVFGRGLGWVLVVGSLGRGLGRVLESGLWVGCWRGGLWEGSLGRVLERGLWVGVWVGC